MWFQHNVFQGRKEFHTTFDELYENSQGVAIWAKTSARLRGVQVQNCTPLCLKENGPPSWGISPFTSLEINKVSPASMFTAFQTSES